MASYKAVSPANHAVRVPVITKPSAGPRWRDQGPRDPSCRAETASTSRPPAPPPAPPPIPLSPAGTRMRSPGTISTQRSASSGCRPRSRAAAPRGTSSGAVGGNSRNDGMSRWSACRCETTAASTWAASLAGRMPARRRRCATRIPRTGSVSSRMPESSISTVLCPHHVTSIPPVCPPAVRNEDHRRPGVARECRETADRRCRTLPGRRFSPIRRRAVRRRAAH